MPVAVQVGAFLQSIITRGYPLRDVSQVYTPDLNLDGNSDLVVLGASYPSTGGPVAQPGLVAFGNGSGGFTMATEAQFPLSTLKTVHPREVVFADFNRDGRPDVFVASHGYDTMPFPGEQNRLYLSNANGTWRDATSLLPQLSDFSHGASAGDVNGDGHLDLLVVNVPQPNPEQPYIMLNDGTGRFTRNDSLLPTGPGQLLNGGQIRMTSGLLDNLDGDGRVDMVAGSFESTTATPKPAFVLWSTNGAYSTTSMTTLPLPRHFGANQSVYDVQALDLNRDGHKDLLVAYQNSVALGGWELQVLVNDGNRGFTDQTMRYIPEVGAQTGGFPSASSAPSQYWVQFLNVMDLNSDGRMDFVADARGITSAPSTLPVAFVQQADGSFQTARAADLAGSNPWLMDYTTQPITWAGNTGFVKLGFENGVVTAFTLPTTFAPVLPVRTDFTEPVRRTGTQRDDTLAGGAGNDTFRGAGGNDTLDGAAGLDAAQYSSAMARFTITRAGTSWTVRDTTGAEGTDTVSNMERLVFADKSLALDISGNAGLVAKVLGAVFGASAVTNQAYVGIGLGYLDAGMSYANLMQLAIDAKLGARAPSAAVANLLYTNVVGSAPDSATLAGLTALLDNGTYTPGTLGVLAGDTALNTTRINLVGLAQTGLEFV